MNATPEIQKKIVNHLATHAVFCLSGKILPSQNRYKEVCRWITGFAENILLLNEMGILNIYELRKLQTQAIDEILHLDEVTETNVKQIIESKFSKQKK